MNSSVLFRLYYFINVCSRLLLSPWMYCGKTVNTHVFVDVVVPADFQVMTVKENSTWKCARSTNAIPTPTMYSQPCGPLFLTQVIHLQIFTLLPSRDTFVCLSPFMFSIHLLAERVLCKTLKWKRFWGVGDGLDRRMLSDCVLFWLFWWYTPRLRASAGLPRFRLDRCVCDPEAEVRSVVGSVFSRSISIQTPACLSYVSCSLLSLISVWFIRLSHILIAFLAKSMWTSHCLVSQIHQNILFCVQHKK